MRKKIAVIGAQGVGKTSLVKEIIRRVPDSLLVREVARECPYPIDAQADFRTEMWMLAHAILAEKESDFSDTAKTIITDRCVLDLAVYSRLVHLANPSKISRAELNFLLTTIKLYMEASPYDHVLLVTVSDEIWQKRDLDDGFRSLDLDWYKKLSVHFRIATKLLRKDTTKLHVLTNDGNFESLVEKALQIVS